MKEHHAFLEHCRLQNHPMLLLTAGWAGRTALTMHDSTEATSRHLHLTRCVALTAVVGQIVVTLTPTQSVFRESIQVQVSISCV